MDKIDYFLLTTLPFEGGWSEDPDDPGGATWKGWTLATIQSLKFDKNSDGSIDKRDLLSLTYDDMRLLLKKGGYYDPSYEAFTFELSNQLIDWAWGGAFAFRNKIALPIVHLLESTVDYETISYFLLFLSAYRYRLRNDTGAYKNIGKYKRGWFKKRIAIGIRAVFGVTVDSDAVLSTFDYDKTNFSPVNIKV